MTFFTWITSFSRSFLSNVYIVHAVAQLQRCMQKCYLWTMCELALRANDREANRKKMVNRLSIAIRIIKSRVERENEHSFI